MNETRTYTLAFLALLGLLGATFALAHVPLGSLALPAGLAIAAAKAALVATYFMHLRKEDGLHRVAAGLGVFWFGILVTLAMSDYLTRGWLWLPGAWPPR